MMGVTTKLQKQLIIQSDSESSREQDELEQPQKKAKIQHQKSRTLSEPELKKRKTVTLPSSSSDDNTPITTLNNSVQQDKILQKIGTANSSEDEKDRGTKNIDEVEKEEEEEDDESSEGERLLIPKSRNQKNKFLKGQDDVWVCCDLCKKWRRLNQVQAKKLDKKASWDCTMNPDRKHASCRQAQELSDKQIDLLLTTAKKGRSRDVSQESEELQNGQLRRPVVWQCIQENIYTHRERKQEQEDDIMICSCQTDLHEGGCYNSDCLNRMLNVECVEGWCPCEDKCHNQRFKNKIYAELEVNRAGKKGFGLFALQDIKKDSFIIEYVGEVLEEDEYQRRAHFYEQTGQRHFYFMNLGNGEVIDAARKGNYARFINHSCEPNCETQKWLVRGELCIGLFAKEDIKKGEELTFDYNFDRHGDKPVKCYCGSLGCRGVIGGGKDFLDSINDLNIQDDPEPIMVQENETDYKEVVQQILDQEVGIQISKIQPKRIDEIEKFVKSKGLGKPREFLISLESDVSRFISKQGNNRAQLKAIKRATGDGKYVRLKRNATFSQVNGRKRVRDTNSSSGGATSSVSGEAHSDGAPSETVFGIPDRRVGRSEINRRLETLRPQLQQANPLTEVVARFLRLFNLCDITRLSDNTQNIEASDQNHVEGFEIQSSKRCFTGKQKARLADLSMLLDVITGVGHHSSKSQLIKCGVLSQLHHLMRKLLQFEDSQADIMIKKCLKVMDHLPLDPHALHSVRSAQGGFGHLFNILIAQENKDIRRLALNVSQQYPCPPELQYRVEYSPPPQHPSPRPLLSPSIPPDQLFDDATQMGSYQPFARPFPPFRNTTNSIGQILDPPSSFFPPPVFSSPPHPLGLGVGQENLYPPYQHSGFGVPSSGPVPRPMQSQWQLNQQSQSWQSRQQSIPLSLPPPSYLGSTLPNMGSGGNPNPPPFQRSVRPWWSHQSHQQQQQQDLWGLPQQRLQGPSEQGFGYPYGNELQQYNQQQLQQQPYQQQLVPLEEQAMEVIPRPPVIHSPPPPQPPPEEATPSSPPPPPEQPQKEDSGQEGEQEDDEDDNPMLPPHLLGGGSKPANNAPAPPPPPPLQVLDDQADSDSYQGPYQRSARIQPKLGDLLDMFQEEEEEQHPQNASKQSQQPFDVEHSFTLHLWDWKTCLLQETDGDETDEQKDTLIKQESEMIKQMQSVDVKDDKNVTQLDQIVLEDKKFQEDGGQMKKEVGGMAEDISSPPAKKRKIEGGVVKDEIKQEEQVQEQKEGLQEDESNLLTKQITDEQSVQKDGTIEVVNLPDEWSAPDEQFQNFVTSTIQLELQHYQQEGSGYQVTNSDADQLLKKLSQTVIQKEYQAFQIRQRKGISKPILRDKIQTRIQDFTKSSVRRFQIQDAKKLDH